MLISIVIPCLNEEKYIAKCLDSVLENKKSDFEIEILVVDGKSDDGTVEIVKGYQARHENIRLLFNEKRIVSSAMNLGIKQAKGEVIMRIDAHCLYEEDYISKCVDLLTQGDIDNVGGVCKTLPGDSSLKGEAIAISMSHPFGVGNSKFRVGINEAQLVDTVPFGTYWKAFLEEIGLYDEEFVRNQDDELNIRVLKRGGKILLSPDIVSYYYARTELKQLWWMFFQYGYWKTKVLHKHKGLGSFRSYIPPLFIIALLGSLGLAIIPYLAVNISVSWQISRGRNYWLIPYLIVSFAVIHLSYGIGFLLGLVNLKFKLDWRIFERATR